MSSKKQQKKALPVDEEQQEEVATTKTPKRKLEDNGKKVQKSENGKKKAKEQKKEDADADSDAEEQKVEKKPKKEEKKGKKEEAKKEEAKKEEAKKPAQEESQDEEADESMADAADDAEEESNGNEAAEAEEEEGDDDTPALKKPKVAPFAQQSQSKQNNYDQFEVFVTGCSQDIQDDDITALLEGCNITGIKWIAPGGAFAGKGFVKFEDEDSMNKALGFDGSEVKGSTLSIQLPKARGEGKPERRDSGPTNPPSKSLFLGGVADTVTEEAVRDLFKDCGEITSIRWGQRDGQFAGFGHVEFESIEAAQEAIKLSGQNMGGRNIRLDYAAERKEGGGGARGGRGGFGRGGGGGRGRGGRGGFGRGGGRGRGGRGGRY